jgi:hypothetical protein
MAPGFWDKIIALQVADLIAYDGFKAIDEYARGNKKIRQSLSILEEKKFELIIGCLDPPEILSGLASVAYKLIQNNYETES